MSGVHRTLSCPEASGLRLHYLLLMLILIVSIAWSGKKKRLEKFLWGFLAVLVGTFGNLIQSLLYSRVFLAFPAVNAVLLGGVGCLHPVNSRENRSKQATQKQYS